MQSTAQKKNETPLHSVKQTAELTGLTLNQIRLWERRYQLLIPHRDNNGYRMYSQDDIDILRYTFQQIKKGHGIQNISKEVKADRTGILHSFRHSAFQGFKSIKRSQVHLIANYELMINALEIGNPMKFEQLLIQAQVGKGTSEAFQDIELPILSKIEELTEKKHIPAPMYEMAAAIIRRKVLNHIGQISQQTDQPSVLLASSSSELSETELLYTALALTHQQIQVVYPGPFYTAAELKLIAKKYKADSVVYFVKRSNTPQEVKALADELKHHLGDLKLMISGTTTEHPNSAWQAQDIVISSQLEQITERI